MRVLRALVPIFTEHWTVGPRLLAWLRRSSLVRRWLERSCADRAVHHFRSRRSGWIPRPQRPTSRRCTALFVSRRSSNGLIGCAETGQLTSNVPPSGRDHRPERSARGIARAPYRYGRLRADPTWGGDVDLADVDCPGTSMEQVHMRTTWVLSGILRGLGNVGLRRSYGRRRRYVGRALRNSLATTSEPS
jgi:hypothetical protein